MKMRKDIQGATVMATVLPPDGLSGGVETVWDVGVRMWVTDFSRGYSAITEESKNGNLPGSVYPRQQPMVIGGAR